MRTKLLTLFRSALLLTVILSTAFTSQAFDFEVDGIYYGREDNTTVYVTFGTYTYSGSVTIPEQVTYDDITYNVTSIGFSAFSYSNNLTSVTIPNSVTSIGNDAFSECTGLTSINIPNSVISIGDFAFTDCTGLTTLTIPGSVTSIGSAAFIFCSSLASICVENGNPNYDSRDNCNAIIETATEAMIAGCKNTVIPNSVTSIGYSAFFGCTGLTSVDIPNSVTSIGDYAFGGCTGLTSVDIPNSVTSIGDYAFSVCTGLTSVDIPNSVTSIGDYAFGGCTGLTSVIIPNSVISDFDNHGIAWFYKCTGLTSVTIGSGITWMGITFLGCPNITRVTCLSPTPPYAQPFIATIDGERIRVYIFSEEIFDHASLYVSAESLDRYQQHPYWNQFQNILPIGEEGTTGDLNGDGEVNIADVNAIINIILGGSDNSQGRSDVNEDGEVNIADANAIINIILS